MSAQKIGAALDAAALKLLAGAKADAAQARADMAKLVKMTRDAFAAELAALARAGARIPFAIAVLTGRIALPMTVTEMELATMLDNLKALVASGQAACTRLVDQAGADATRAADLQQQVNNFEQDAAAAVQPLVDQIVAAAPEAPAEAPQAEVQQ